MLLHEIEQNIIAMARFDSITSENRWDKTEYVVTRDDGTCYKCFTDFDEAKAYYQYLQQLDNQEKLVAQNQQIINNQNAILDFQKQAQQNTPRFIPSKPIFDPEYEEWLRYKKATDTKYQEWKRNEDRKKREAQKKLDEENRIWREQNEKDTIKKSVTQFRNELKQQTDSLNAFIKWAPIFRRILSYGIDSVNYLHDVGDAAIGSWGNVYKDETINKYFFSNESKISYFLNQLKTIDNDLEALSASLPKDDLNTMRQLYNSCQYSLDKLKRDLGDMRFGVVDVYEYLYIIKANFIRAKNWDYYVIMGPLAKVRRACKEYLKKYQDLYVIMKRYNVDLFDGCETIYGKQGDKSIIQKLHDDNYSCDTDDEDWFFHTGTVEASL